MRLRAVAVGAAIALGAVVTACSPTTYDASYATADTRAQATATTLPSGTPQQLLPRMLAAVQGLSTKVASGDGDGATATLIEQYWAALKPEITRSHPDLVDDFEFVVRRCRAAADRNRPADADRAYRNLQELVTAIDGPSSTAVTPSATTPST